MTQDMNNVDPGHKVRSDAARRLVNRLTDTQLVEMDTDEIAATVLDMLYVEPIQADWDRMYFDTNSYYIDRTETMSAHASINVPASGLIGMLHKVQPSVISSISANAGGGIISRTWHGSEEQIAVIVDRFSNELEAWRNALGGSIVRANQMIEEERSALIGEISRMIEPRRCRVTAVARAAQRANIPVGPVADALPIPLNTKPVNLTRLDRAIESGTPEWILEESISNDIVETIKSFSKALERAPLTACKIANENEEAIRDVLLFILNANYRGMATGETFLGHGKADVLLRWKNRDAFVGECKIWDGPAKFIGAIGQLLGRYTIWRDTRVALIIFVIDRKDPSRIVADAENCVRSHPLYFRTNARPDGSHEYQMRSAVDQERLVRMSVIPVVLNSQIPPEAE
jgi:hypothetical protein